MMLNTYIKLILEESLEEKSGKLKKALAGLATAGMLGITSPTSANTIKQPDALVKKEKEKISSKRLSREEVAPIIRKASNKYNVSFNLIDAVIQTESGYKPSAKSRVGAIGLMQLMPDVASYFGVKDLYDPEQNIMGGTKYLSRLLKRFDGDVELVLAAYNAGIGNVLKYKGIPPFKETQNYVKKVLQRMRGRV